jgi:hypothetical protein
MRERRRPGRRLLTNVIHLLSREWLAWLDRRGGFKKNELHDHQNSDAAENYQITATMLVKQAAVGRRGRSG